MNASLAVSLYNFDHGFDSARLFRFGPYEFDVTQAHVEAAARLPRHGLVHQTWDENGHPVVEDQPVKHGEAGETAVVRLVDPLPPTQPLLGGPPDPGGFGVLCILLSFLTGRRVLRAEDRTTFDGMHYGERVVGENYFWTVGTWWPDLVAVEREGLGPALWATVDGLAVRDLIGQTCYASAALDLVVTRWARSQPASIDPALKSKINAAAAAAQAGIRAELGDSALTEDILPRVRGIFEPSAVARLAAYLGSKKMVSVPPTANEMKRVRLLNAVRNRVVHAADVPSDLNPDVTRRAEIAAVVRAVATNICCLRLCEAMGVCDWLVERSREEIQSFFAQGQYNGFRVFDEDYASFIDRVREDWVTAMFGNQPEAGA